MKKLIILLSLLLSACANDKILIKNNIVVSNEIMKDCEEYKNIKNGTEAELITLLIENKKIYIDCFNQNKAKKEFILRQN